MILLMNLFEKGTFLHGNRAKIVLFEGISDCLRGNRRGEDVVDKMGSLSRIIKLSSGDLMDN